jgi:hypothetical protein
VAMSADALITVRRVFVRRTHASVADMVHLFTGGLRIETFRSRLRGTARPLFSSLIKKLGCCSAPLQKTDPVQIFRILCAGALGPYADSLEDEDGCSP